MGFVFGSNTLNRPQRTAKRSYTNEQPTCCKRSPKHTHYISNNGTAAPVPHSTLARILESIHPTTRIGCAFHIMAGGKLSRRGIVLDDKPHTYSVQFVDVWGLPHGEMKTVSKERTDSWKWYVDVEHSNVVYDKVFGVQ